MTEPLADRIQVCIDEAKGLFYHLVLVVAPSGSGKTAALQQIARRAGYPLLNVNLELARRLLELTERQRALQVGTGLGVEPWAYLQDVLTRLPATPAGKLGDLLPEH